MAAHGEDSLVEGDNIRKPSGIIVCKNILRQVIRIKREGRDVRLGLSLEWDLIRFSLKNASRAASSISVSDALHTAIWRQVGRMGRACVCESAAENKESAVMRAQ